MSSWSFIDLSKNIRAMYIFVIAGNIKIYFNKFVFVYIVARYSEVSANLEKQTH